MAGSPLLGYNTNVRHHGKLYHIQTEDSGATHGHIFTHLFADGGRIIASKKTTYKEYIGTERFPAIVKKLMRESHKAMFIALRDGLFDTDEAAGARTIAAMELRLDDSAEVVPSSATVPASAEPASAEPTTTVPIGAGPTGTVPVSAGLISEDTPEEPAPIPLTPNPSPTPSDGVDVDALERAAAARLAEAKQAAPPSRDSGRYGPTRPAMPVAATRVSRSSKPASRPDPASESIFGGDLLSEKSLDEVILSYLAEDAED